MMRLDRILICGRVFFCARRGEEKDMSNTELFILAVGLSMDAFAVSICKGMAIRKASAGNMLKAGAYFGGFQALMPLIGYCLGSYFSAAITAVDHWIAFVLLGLIGGNMVKESFSEEKDQDPSMDVKSMILLAIATSIDALAVGVTLAFLKASIFYSVAFIGCTTFLLSAFGVYLGAGVGSADKINAERWGGIILILIGTKILLEHLGFIG